MTVPDAAERITREVGSWDGVEVGPRRFGGVAFHVGRRDLGYLHGDRVADIPFTRLRRDELIAAGRVVEHRFVPASGWTTRHIRAPGDVDDVIALPREGYERARRTGWRAS